MRVVTRALPVGCALLLAALGWTPAAVAGKKVRLAVLAIKAEGAEATFAATVDEVLTAELAKSGRYEVIGRSEIEAMAGFQTERMKLGCTGDAACLAEIGGALGVDRLVFGSLGKAGQSYVLNTKLLEIHGARVIARDTEVVRNPDALIAAVARAARILQGDLPAPLAATTESPRVSASTNASEPSSSGGLRHSPWPWVTLGVAAAAAGTGAYFAVQTQDAWQTYSNNANTYTTRDSVLSAGQTNQIVADSLFGAAIVVGLVAVGMLVFGGGGP
jgi:TolB-like protein